MVNGEKNVEYRMTKLEKTKCQSDIVTKCHRKKVTVECRMTNVEGRTQVLWLVDLQSESLSVCIRVHPWLMAFHSKFEVSVVTSGLFYLAKT